jgi:hypothetical protein
LKRVNKQSFNIRRLRPQEKKIMVDRKTRKSPLTKQMFWAIKRTINLAVVQRDYDAHKIALEHGVSDETVRAVRRTGTWPKYEAVKVARNLRRGRTHQVPVPPVEPISSPRPGVAVGGSPLITAESAQFGFKRLKEAVESDSTPAVTMSSDKRTLRISVEDYNRLVAERNEYRAELAKSSKHNTSLQIDLLAATRRWSWLPWRSN